MPACTHPVTGLARVSRIYTDLMVIDVGADGVRVREMAEGISFDDLQPAAGVPLQR